ncbi:replication factor A protein, partial [Trifolium medium]|nr:replication factor A protein [Trifolium medium]
FRNRVTCCSDGLPIVLLQFVKVNISQGATLVEGVEGVTRMFVDPTIAEVVNFRNGLVHYLSRGLDYIGLLRSSGHTPLSCNLDFIKDYPVRTMAELKNNPQLGVFVVNARICDIVNFDPWWYPVCKCPRIFEKYIGAFHCVKCQLSKFIAAPKVKLTFEVDDETGYGLFKAFDHVMVNVAAVNSSFQLVNVT